MVTNILLNYFYVFSTKIQKARKKREKAREKREKMTKNLYFFIICIILQKKMNFKNIFLRK